MKRLIVVTGLIGLVGCDGSRMDLGPEGRSTVGGAPIRPSDPMGGGAGTCTKTENVGGSIVTSSSIPIGVGGVSPAAGMPSTIGGNHATGGSAGNTGDDTFHGIELDGVDTLSLTISGGMPFGLNAVCDGPEPVVYSVDFATKTLTRQQCVVADDGVTQTTAQESRTLSDPEITATHMMLERISTDYQKTCIKDIQDVSLVLNFGDHVTTYQDEKIGRECSDTVPPGINYVAGLRELQNFLGSSLRQPAIPSSYELLQIEDRPLQNADPSTLPTTRGAGSRNRWTE